MILIAGIPTEGPTALVIEALEAIGVGYRCFDQRSADGARIELEVADDHAGGAIGGRIDFAGEALRLEDVRGLYMRLMDDRFLPGQAVSALQQSRRRALHEIFLRWSDMAPCRVLNRPTDMTSNQSKPFQAHVIRAHGFGIPETLITNDPDAARNFIETVWGEGGDVVYKSLSGIRSIVERVTAADLKRLDRIRWCPTQFQRRVAGTDIRVHVVGRTALAAMIESDAVDYRYAARQVGAQPSVTRVELEASFSERCVALAAALNLPLAGIDLRRTPAGALVCFEVNPSPAFSFYEQRAGVPVSAAIARYLAGDAE